MTNSTQVKWENGQNNCAKTLLRDASGAKAELYRHGAHLTSWQTASGKEWLFLSDQAVFAPGKAIRGGVPVIFPQFNAFGDGPRHGFARNIDWQDFKLISNNQIQCTLKADQNTAAWPYLFQAQLVVTLTETSLDMAFQVTNTDSQPFQFTCALHSYFSVGHLSKTSVSGFQGLDYWDNDGSPFSQRKVFEEESLNLCDAIDRVFFDYARPIKLDAQNASLQITHKGFSDVVVWNPGQVDAQALQDFGDDEYKNMVCIEAAQIDKPIKLTPGQTWQGSQMCSELSCSEHSCSEPSLQSS